MGQSIEQAVAEASKWADLPGIVLVGQGETSEGTPCILVKISTDVAQKIPSTFQGFPVIVEPTDEIVAQRRQGTRTSR